MVKNRSRLRRDLFRFLLNLFDMLFGPPGFIYLGSLRVVIFKLCSIFELAFCGEAAALVLSSSPSVVGCLHVSEGEFQRYVSEVVSGARFPGTK